MSYGERFYVRVDEGIALAQRTLAEAMPLTSCALARGSRSVRC